MSLYVDIQTETFNDVKINPELTEQQKLEVMELLEEFQDVFTDVPGLTTLGGGHSINLTSMDPVHSKPYPIFHVIQEVVEKELKTMLSSIKGGENVGADFLSRHTTDSDDGSFHVEHFLLNDVRL